MKIRDIIFTRVSLASTPQPMDIGALDKGTSRGKYKFDKGKKDGEHDRRQEPQGQASRQRRVQAGRNGLTSRERNGEGHRTMRHASAVSSRSTENVTTASRHARRAEVNRPAPGRDCHNEVSSGWPHTIAWDSSKRGQLMIGGSVVCCNCFLFFFQQK